MKKINLIALFLTMGLNAFGQTLINTNDTRKSYQTGAYLFDLDSDGRLRKINASGVKTFVDVDLTKNNLVAPLHTFTTLRALTLSSADAPNVVQIFDLIRGRGGRFSKNASNTTDIDDNGLTIVTASGVRYERDLSEPGVIVPQYWGAVGDSLTNDFLALDAWIKKNGAYKLVAPAGRYLSLGALRRINKGNVVFEGAGASQTKFIFPNDTDGIELNNQNPGYIPTYYGSMIAKGFQVVSTGPKTNRTGLFVSSQNEQRPGPLIEDVSIWGIGEGKEWKTAIMNYMNSGSRIKGVDIIASSFSVTTGISTSAATGIPGTEHIIDDFRIFGTNVGMGFYGQGYPGTEGVIVTNGAIGASFRGIEATSPAYGAPQYIFSNMHINTFGGEALYTDGVQHIVLNATEFYINVNPLTGTIPTRGMYFKNLIGLGGVGNTLVTTSSTPYGAVFESNGPGGLIDWHVNAIVNNNSTDVMWIDDEYVGATTNIKRIFNGSSGSGGTDIVGPGAANTGRTLHAYYNSLINKQLLRYNTGNGKWEGVSAKLAKTESYSVVSPTGPTSYTIDPSSVGTVFVNNGVHSTTLVMNANVAVDDYDIIVTRFDNGSTGPIYVRNIDNAFQPTQLGNGVRSTASNGFSLPTTTGQRTATFKYVSGSLYLTNGNDATPADQRTALGLSTVASTGAYSDLSGTPSPYTLPNATATTFGGTKLRNLQFFSTNSSSPTSNTVTLGTGPQMIMINNTGSGTHTIYIDQASATDDQDYIVSRYADTDNGPIIVTLIDTTGNKIQNFDKALSTSVVLPTATGQRQMKLWFHSPHFYNMGY